MTSATAPQAPSQRISSLDQYRGYAIFGMLLVNFFGYYSTRWIDGMQASSFKDFLYFIFGEQLHHHGEYMTYADTVAPIFMFVVGIGMRLSWTRRVDTLGPWKARRSIAKRYGILILISCVVYYGYLWDALMNIGLAGLLALVIIDRKPATRFIFALALLLAYQWIFSATSYGEWLLRMGDYGQELEWPAITSLLPLRGYLLDCQINGGLIGHWSWAMMLICGTIAYDIMATRDRNRIIASLLIWGLALAAVGWGVRASGTDAYYAKAEPYDAACMLEEDWNTAKRIVDKSPGIFSSMAQGNAEAEAALESGDINTFAALMHSELERIAFKPDPAPRLGNEWVFSKNYMTMPFAFWATALCFFHLLGFYLLCDVVKVTIPGMKIMGMNPLFLYLFQLIGLFLLSMAFDQIDLDKTESGLVVLGSFALFFSVCFGFAYFFYKKNIIIKL